MPGKHWTEDELTYIEYFVFEKDAKLSDASEFLGRSVNAIKKKLWRLRTEDNNVKHMNRLWTEKEEEFLKKHYTSLSNKNIAIRLRRSVKSVEFRAAKLGLKKYKKIQDKDFEIRKLISEGYYLSEICKELNIKMQSLIAHCRRENISYKKMPRTERADYGNHIWNKLGQASYQEYLNKQRRKVK